MAEHAVGLEWIRPATGLLTWLQGVVHLGQEVQPGDWAVIDGKLAYIDSVFKVSHSQTSIFGISAAVYNDKLIHFDSDGSFYAVEDELNDESSYQQHCYQLSTVSLLMLITALFQRRRRFIELP